MIIPTGKKEIIAQTLTMNPEHIILKKNAELTYVMFIGHDQNELCEITFELEGVGARLTILAFDIGKKYEAKMISRIVHKGRETFSRTFVQSLLGGTAQSRFHGLIRLEKTAVNADAGFIHNTLLVGDGAKGQAEPTLEIFANEVKAKHAATVTTFDANAIFYLKTRGLNELQAQRVIAEGFAQKYVPLIQSTTTREKVRDHVLKNIFLV